MALCLVVWSPLRDLFFAEGEEVWPCVFIVSRAYGIVGGFVCK